MGLKTRRTSRYGRMTKRDAIIERNTASQFYALLSGRPNVMALEPVPDARKREGRPSGISEHQIQAAVIRWWDLAHGQFGVPWFALAAVPNGGARDAITGSRLKAEGVRPGFPDLLLTVPRDLYHGFLCELKTPTGSLSPSQKEWLEYLDRAGYKTAVCRTVDSAIAAITEYLRPPPNKQENAALT